MSVPRADFAAVALPNGKVLLIGGQTSSTADTAAVDLFDPSSDAVTSVAPMHVARAGHIAALLPTGKVLVAGGSSAPGSQALASAELYDPAANTWTAAASMAQAREHSAALVMPNGRVFVAGGEGGGFVADATGYEIYDAATNTWTGTSPMYGDRPHGPAVAALKDGRVIVYGGMAQLQPGNQYEFYDPVTSQDSYGRTIPDTYDFTTAAVLPDGSVMFAGGQAGYNPAGPLNTTYVFTPNPESFTAGPAMSVGHCHHTMTALSNGRWLVAGGGGCVVTDPNAVAEIYEPVAKKWWPAGSMQSARGYHTAVRLPDGRVLVAGGFVAGGAPTASTEIYTPAA